ncbi:MAG: hypothetical protein SF053_22500 [Bacteroidia bacterium]|nr:hypothetical protein [Bacteroidia bacterium]
MGDKIGETTAFINKGLFFLRIKKRCKSGIYSRSIPPAEIAAPKNDYNLIIPRYIDSQENEDIQDIEAHLRGGIPTRDIEAYWTVYASLKTHLFSPIAGRPGYFQLNCANKKIKNSITTLPGRCGGRDGGKG